MPRANTTFADEKIFDGDGKGLKGFYRPRNFGSAVVRQRFRRDRRRRLVRELGGTPTTPQSILLDRAVDLEWQILARLARPGERSEHASRELAAWHNHLRLTLKALGIERREPPKPQPLMVEDEVELLLRRLDGGLR